MVCSWSPRQSLNSLPCCPLLHGPFISITSLSSPFLTQQLKMHFTPALTSQPNTCCHGLFLNLRTTYTILSNSLYLFHKNMWHSWILALFFSTINHSPNPVSASQVTLQSVPFFPVPLIKASLPHLLGRPLNRPPRPPPFSPPICSLLSNCIRLPEMQLKPYHSPAPNPPRACLG